MCSLGPLAVRNRKIIVNVKIGFFFQQRHVTSWFARHKFSFGRYTVLQIWTQGMCQASELYQYSVTTALLISSWSQPLHECSRELCTAFCRKIPRAAWNVFHILISIESATTLMTCYIQAACISIGRLNSVSERSARWWWFQGKKKMTTKKARWTCVAVGFVCLTKKEKITKRSTRRKVLLESTEKADLRGLFEARVKEGY